MIIIYIFGQLTLKANAHYVKLLEVTQSATRGCIGCGYDENEKHY